MEKPLLNVSILENVLSCWPAWYSVPNSKKIWVIRTVNCKRLYVTES